jgi:uncharacterized surface protein with fasciclin (FAS1) repeats
MISVSNHEFVELRQQQPQCKTHFVFTDIDIADLDIPEISSAKYQLKNGNIGTYKKDSSSSTIALSRSNKGKKIVAIAVVLLGLILLGAGMFSLMTIQRTTADLFLLYFRHSCWSAAPKLISAGGAIEFRASSLE